MLRLELPSTPECGTFVRAILMGVGHSLAWDGELVDDLKTAVTEACNNVVLHAYPGGVGKLVMRLEAEGEWIEVLVCDEGEGFRGVAAGDDHLHVGLPVISSLAERVEYLSPPEGGTEVRMFFRARDRVAPAQPPELVQAGQRRWGPDAAMLSEMAGSWTADTVSTLVGDDELLQGDVVGVISPAALLGPALGRLVRALAAGNHFRIDRFSALRVLTDTLGAHARAAASDHRLAFAITASERRLEIAAGHFTPGSGAVFTGDGSGNPASPLRDFADELTVGPGQRGEIVRLVVSDPR
ncbi:MAG TPA: ATP-binding protein [Solirubrobacteraceae bacterium]|nr:ATP-binding protein [Solirubrobacteraceae bacterium]